MIIKNKDEFIHSIARLLFFAKMPSDDKNDEMLEIILAGLDSSIDGELSEAIQEEMINMVRRYERFEKMLHIFAGDSNVDSK
ncbi:hypothetical protein SY212_18220 [Ligilactobacillus agilis]|uniref:Uncharacterized protein n=1 Tax=Ligilactobacillus agilis TaxID=1601 RepID=A0A6F9XNG2_9LACO|nr:hypothetical protein [Ligilactobacillus agilis]GET06792.1 hypothetical protein SY212_18220 [Ligilactobacillus agilis]